MLPQRGAATDWAEVGPELRFPRASHSPVSVCAVEVTQQSVHRGWLFQSGWKRTNRLFSLSIYPTFPKVDIIYITREKNTIHLTLTSKGEKGKFYPHMVLNKVFRKRHQTSLADWILLIGCYYLGESLGASHGEEYACIFEDAEIIQAEKAFILNIWIFNTTHNVTTNFSPVI